MQHTTAPHRSAANGVKMSPAGTSAPRARARQSRPANLRFRSGDLVTAPHTQLLLHESDSLLAARALSCARAVRQNQDLGGVVAVPCALASRCSLPRPVAVLHHTPFNRGRD